MKLVPPAQPPAERVKMLRSVGIPDPEPVVPFVQGVIKKRLERGQDKPHDQRRELQTQLEGP